VGFQIDLSYLPRKVEPDKTTLLAGKFTGIGAEGNIAIKSLADQEKYF
jgi:hypothetical protein